MSTRMPKLIDAQALRECLDRGEALLLLDVREPMEVAICRIPEATHIPMREVPDRLDELDPKVKTVLYCHHGQRSHMVASFLLDRGFDDVYHLDGGIDEYAETIDPSMARY